MRGARAVASALCLGLLAVGPLLAAGPESLYGAWTGSLTCADGVRKLSLSLVPRDGSESLKGTLVFGETLAKPDDVTAGWIRVEGEAEGSRVHLRATDWTSEPLGRDLISLDGTQDTDEAGHARIAGKATGQGCTRFELTYDETQFDLDP